MVKRKTVEKKDKVRGSSMKVVHEYTKSNRQGRFRQTVMGTPPIDTTTKTRKRDQ